MENLKKMSKIFPKIRLTFPCPDLSSNINPFSVPISRLTPQRAAQSISELNRFLYLRISGVSLAASCDVGVTFTFTSRSLDSRRDGPEPPAPNPNVKKLLCFCCRAIAFGGNKWCIGDWCLLGELWWWLTLIKLLLLMLFNLLLWLLLIIEFFGLLWRDDVEELLDTVDWGEELDMINDLDGVEWTELTAARY